TYVPGVPRTFGQTVCGPLFPPIVVVPIEAATVSYPDRSRLIFDEHRDRTRRQALTLTIATNLFASDPTDAAAPAEPDPEASISRYADGVNRPLREVARVRAPPRTRIAHHQSGP